MFAILDRWNSASVPAAVLLIQYLHSGRKESDVQFVQYVGTFEMGYFG
jgi:hypothetical protein